MRFIARSGLKTLIVLIADKFLFSTLRQYSKALKKKEKKLIFISFCLKYFGALKAVGTVETF